uniref:Uncharacterized protein n=2 Tax=Ciona intestinalis TaxID=7719 RepID=H2XWT0_CIOIN
MAYGEQKTSNGLRRFSIRNNQPNKPTELTGTKKQLTHQECNYTMAMQKQRQEFVNESVTQKVWQFLGYKPVSMEGL